MHARLTQSLIVGAFSVWAAISGAADKTPPVTCNTKQVQSEVFLTVCSDGSRTFTATGDPQRIQAEDRREKAEAAARDQSRRQSERAELNRTINRVNTEAALASAEAAAIALDPYACQKARALQADAITFKDQDKAADAIAKACRHEQSAIPSQVSGTPSRRNPPPAIINQPAAGAINVTNGQYYPPVAGGVINPQTGTFFPSVAGGYVNSKTGEFVPTTK